MITGNEPHVKGPLAEAMDKLFLEIVDGLKHGFFELSVTCETVRDHKRRLTIKSGKSHQFIVREEEFRD